MKATVEVNDKIVRSWGKTYFPPDVTDVQKFGIESFCFLLPEQGTFSFTYLAERIKEVYDLRNNQTQEVYNALIAYDNPARFGLRIFYTSVEFHYDVETQESLHFRDDILYVKEKGRVSWTNTFMHKKNIKFILLFSIRNREVETEMWWTEEEFQYLEPLKD